ncbi:MAG: hypothetical protein A2445_04030 [Candidatus Jacksonbacteria bacterium RIFOXYC2_FULL_44_29]|nr:MAG: hypothetical protein UV19_C0001G0049 [Parcubacteria group bacterium GW2011_GWA2_42_28]KKT56244.1 MAG: hypothetical protein UW45_C0001G0048 [Parcubacteria group bacterium GW2011_GWC2_44_22]OGY76108.1 MAG: hypothetical protein A2240_00250 [Candidatus Jacksonbacteria bacterium RIFOXYA2_FULL_43_12]OGY77699.1 MAG: hypothetical protein A2295_02750 [Candidatus Jacksonbacteria bacterium RIFOXYB2_FULL_44_15]OGY78835.1 MAG: hypothetical protein A2550_04815 [Candidatus Jacksonbacteria bacterium RI
MKDNWYVVLLWLSGAISWLLFGAVVIFIGPDELGIWSRFLFLVTSTLANFTFWLIILYYLRVKLLRFQPVFRQFHIIFRESILLAGLFAASLWLSHYGRMSFFYFLLMFLIIAGIDLFFILSYDQRRYKKIK